MALRKRASQRSTAGGKGLVVLVSGCLDYTILN